MSGLHNHAHRPLVQQCFPPLHPQTSHEIQSQPIQEDAEIPKATIIFQTLNIKSLPMTEHYQDCLCLTINFIIVKLSVQYVPIIIPMQWKTDDTMVMSICAQIQLLISSKLDSILISQSVLRLVFAPTKQSLSPFNYIQEWTTVNMSKTPQGVTCVKCIALALLTCWSFKRNRLTLICPITILLGNAQHQNT